MVLLTLVGITGCGTKTVSPALQGKQGVTTGVGPDGYPIVKSIVFQRAAAPTPRVMQCVQSEIDGLSAPPIELDGAVKAKGKAFAHLQFSNYVSFALTIRGGDYTFDRLNHAGESGPTFELMASSHGSPENAYRALESIADRVSDCSKG